MYSEPAESEANLGAPAIANGVVDNGMESGEAASSPTRFSPQQNVVLSAVSAHVCQNPTEIAVQRMPPATATAEGCRSVSPMPSCPKSFSPQQ